MLITIDLTELKEGLDYVNNSISKRLKTTIGSSENILSRKKQVVKHILLSVIGKYFFKEINSIQVELISNSDIDIHEYIGMLQFSMYEVLDSVFENIEFNFTNVDILYIDGVLRGNLLVLSLEFSKEN